MAILSSCHGVIRAIGWQGHISQPYPIPCPSRYTQGLIWSPLHAASLHLNVGTLVDIPDTLPPTCHQLGGTSHVADQAILCYGAARLHVVFHL